MMKLRRCGLVGWRSETAGLSMCGGLSLFCGVSRAALACLLAALPVAGAQAQPVEASQETAPAATSLDAGLSSGVALEPWSVAALVTIGALVGAGLAYFLRRRGGARDDDYYRDPGAIDGDPEGLSEVTGDARDDLAEGRRLFRYFEERFGLEERSADAAIGYLERVADSIHALRRKASAAGPSGADPARAAAPHAAPPAAAAMSNGAKPPAADLADEATRVAAAAIAALRADSDFTAFSDAMQLEAALRRFSAERDLSAAPSSEVVEEAWPHAIFRAEAVLAAYYPAIGPWSDLRYGVTAAATALRALLRRQRVYVGYVRLLSPFEPETSEKWSNSADELTALAPVRRGVLGRASLGSDDFVIDCESFGYFDQDRALSVRSRMILFDRDAWGARP